MKIVIVQLSIVKTLIIVTIVNNWQKRKKIFIFDLKVIFYKNDEQNNKPMAILFLEQMKFVLKTFVFNLPS